MNSSKPKFYFIFGLFLLQGIVKKALRFGNWAGGHFKNALLFRTTVDTESINHILLTPNTHDVLSWKGLPTAYLGLAKVTLSLHVI
jgi:hypothetical protein